MPANALPVFRVTLTYREPSYARSRGIEVLDYEATYRICAPNPQKAIAAATNDFHEAQRSSSVSWAREIVATVCDLELARS